jgi:hypothetical protein
MDGLAEASSNVQPVRRARRFQHFEASANERVPRRAKHGEVVIDDEHCDAISPRAPIAPWRGDV